MEQDKKKKINFKIIIPIVIAIVVIAIVAVVAIIGNNKGVNNNVNKTLSITDKATTNQVEFTITNLSFKKSLTSYKGNFLTDEEYGIQYVRGTMYGETVKPSNTDNILYLMEYSVKNIGNTQIQNDYSKFKIKLKYNNQYEFTVKDTARTTDKGNWTNNSYSVSDVIAPLSSERKYRTYFDIPKEIQENEELPLEITLCLPNGNGEYTNFIYKIR